MNFKTFFVQKVVIGFFVSFTLISIAMLILGYTFEPDRQFGYDIFLSPLVFALVATIPSMLGFSSKEMSVKQAIIRKIILLVLLEVLILSVLYIANIITSINMFISLGVSIALIDGTAELVLWVNDRKTATQLTNQIKHYQKQMNQMRDKSDS